MNKHVFFFKPLHHYKHCSLFLCFCWEHQRFFLYKFLHGWFWRIIFFSLLDVLKHNLGRLWEAAGGPARTSRNMTRLSADASSVLPLRKNKQKKRQTRKDRGRSTESPASRLPERPGKVDRRRHTKTTHTNVAILKDSTNQRNNNNEKANPHDPHREHPQNEKHLIPHREKIVPEVTASDFSTCE